MDYYDPVLKEIFDAEYADKYKVFVLYKAFIDWDRDRNSEEAINQIRHALYFLDQQNCNNDDFRNCDEFEHFKKIDSDDIKNKLYRALLSRQLLNDIDIDGRSFNNALPFWLILKDHEILEANYTRYPLRILSKRDFTDTEEFNKLIETLYRMVEGSWQFTSYMWQPGSIWIDYRHALLHYSQFISFNPEVLITDREIEFNFAPINAWSSEGLWNRLLYKKFISLFKDAVVVLENYYKNDKYFSKYSKDARLILSSIVHSFIFDNRIASSNASKALQESNRNLTKLKYSAQGFEQKDKDELLGRMILEGYDSTAIKWVVEFGADVNAMSFGETAVMKAANNPNLINILISLGAEIDATNRFGKTALFYAIQFGDLESVKVFIDAGADINKQLHSYEKLKHDYKEGSSYDLAIEAVADFTPLIYALRDGSDGVFDLLVKSGAKKGTAPDKRIDEWVRQGPTDLK